MEMMLEVLFSKMWILAEQLDKISRMGRRVIITGNQIRQLARRSRNRFSSNRPVALVEDPKHSRESYKRLYTCQLAEETRRRAMYREADMARGNSDLYLDCSDDSAGELVQASNGGNLYGGNGTGTSKRNHNKANNDEAASNGGNGSGRSDELDSVDGTYEGLEPAVIHARQGWDVYGNTFPGIASNGRMTRVNGKKSRARRLLTLGNISIVDSSDSD